MLSRIVKDLVGSSTVGKARNTSRSSRSSCPASCMEMLAAVSQGAGEFPAWVIVELETREKAEREPSYGEGRKG